MEVLHRFFFAVVPPRRLRGRIAGHRERFPDLSSIVANDRLHMTAGITADYADYPEGAANGLLAIGAQIAADPVVVMLDRLSASRTSVALRPSRASRPLRSLFEALDGPLVREGLRRPGWTPSPHVTLGYRNGEPFSAQIEAVAWEAQEFVLIHSLVGRTQHIELGRWPLQARQGELFH